MILSEVRLGSVLTSKNAELLRLFIGFVLDKFCT